MPIVQAGSKRLEYFDAGSGDDIVVLIHGAGSSAVIWHEIQALMAADGFRTIAISLLGAGGSDRTTRLEDYTPASYAADIRAALDALGISRFAIAGHSLGVSNVLNLAADHGQDLSIRALILMAGGNVIGREAESAERAEEIRSRYRPPDPSTEDDRRAAWEGVHQGLSRDTRDQLWLDIQNNPMERTVGQRLGARKDMTEFAGRCEIPALIISGDADSVVPLEHTLAMYPKFRREVRHCHVIHGVDHYPNAQVPKQVAETYVRFLRRHQQP